MKSSYCLRMVRGTVLLVFALVLGGHILSAQTLPPGPQVLTFFSDLDDTEQPYCIYIPKDFDENKRYPLVVMLHGAGSNHRLAMRRVFGNSNINGETDVEASRYFPPWKDVDMIVAAPYARGTGGYQDFIEQDVLDMVHDVRSRFKIDTNRTYLTGLSMGGGGTLWIGLGHPDIWAAIVAVCPAPPEGTDALAPNALNMAVKFVHGTEDPAVPVKVSREWVDRLTVLTTVNLEYLELPGVDHFSWVQAYADGQIFDWFDRYTRNPFPNRVRHAAHDLAHGKAYWVRMDQKVPAAVAMVDARFSGPNVLQIETSEMVAFTLSLGGHSRFRSDQPLQVRIDNDALDFLDPEETISFTKSSSGAWEQKRYAPLGVYKSAGLEGPVLHAFASRHVYVYGTADNPSEKVLNERIGVAREAADWATYRGEFLGRIDFYPRVIPDKAVRPSDHGNANLILFGTVETNRVIAQYAGTLPIQLRAKAIKKYGLVYVYPNEHGHYLVINSGLPWWKVAEETEWRYTPGAQTTLGQLKDFTLFSKNRNVLIQGYFDAEWQLPPVLEKAVVTSGAVRLSPLE